MREIKKNSLIFIMILLILTIISIFIILFIENLIIKSGIAIIIIISEIILFLHFRSIKYTVSEGNFIKKSGIVFKKTKTVPLDKIVMKSVVSIGKSVIVTIIHTSGSISLIFGEI